MPEFLPSFISSSSAAGYRHRVECALADQKIKFRNGSMPTMFKITTHKKFVYALLVSTAVTIAVLGIGFFVAHKTGNLIAPPITGSVSFDEKLFFIAKTRPIDKINVLAVGSSMTLNNLSSLPVVNGINDKFINFSSWGLSIKQSEYFIRFLVPLYRPKVVIIISSPIDFYFSKRNARLFDNEEVNRYLADANIIRSYSMHFDPLYMLKASRNIKQQRLLNTMYESLLYDPYGGVLFNIDKSNINQERWDTKLNPSMIDDNAYKALERLSNFLAAERIVLVMVQPPIRRAAIAGKEGLIKKHWQRIEDISVKAPFIFVNMDRKLELSDDYFVDYTHLNHKGADIFTKSLVDIIGPACKSALVH